MLTSVNKLLEALVSGVADSGHSRLASLHVVVVGLQCMQPNTMRPIHSVTLAAYSE